MADNNKHEIPESLSRRKFIKNTGLAVGGVALGGALGSLLPFGNKTKENNNQAAEVKAENFNQALMHFSQEQFNIVQAATERIFPETDSGPGAKALGVAFFIDHQLAGNWGFNSREYMHAPFYKGETVQGYQGRLKRREIFDIGLQEMQNYSINKFKKKFTELSGEEQDAILKDFEEDNVQITAILPSGFFKMLRSSTLEGIYSDPLYGGNMNMDGWRMKNYPGNQMAYTNIIEGDFKEMKPKSLRDHLGQ
ncbi:gluconate 2-dehydrogenase subunit 3 family protein [Metabacillus arenae]|uniref:Gluconate 2-dehydrogenase subunit 3 family protein n=1 Tax=Metabacillus arenae TaxID=2771434 RepID=A0A926NKB1_9BACI|nr:gluconate 2-dehydrogenase subunit 3 family protein [Metabacillus arenae]MBD1383349.1 gluconate 2-dehydrogenase subunit 3 family protein [Metabacillus arenae]